MNNNFEEWLNNFQTMTTESTRIFTQFLKDGKFQQSVQSPDPLNLHNALLTAYFELTKEPEFVAKSGLHLYEQLTKLWIDISESFLQAPNAPEQIQQHFDRRFSSEDWEKLPAFKFVKEAYLTYADWLMAMLSEISSLDAKEKTKLEFYIKQFLDAFSPANFAFSNPEVLRVTIETNGKNLAQGLHNLAEDFANGKIRQSDYSAFQLGKNLATTKGSVVYQNNLFQLIQYGASTEKVFATPLLFIPAWINKFYIADLQEKNSLIKWMVDKGYTVFLISWVNPTEAHSEITFDDYVEQGLLKAVDEILRITGEKKINCMGYCLGGTLLASSLAVLKRKKQDKIGAVSFLTTMLDFSDAGEISVFIDEQQISKLEERMNLKGYLDGSEMATTFNMLRSNDLIWSFVINNYLLGKTPFPFDILYWNSDSTRMPAKMHSFYLRNMYLNNLLVKPNALSICGEQIDLSEIDNPAYFLSTKKDHISPWETTYQGAKLLKNAVFTLADSGHVAGVVNPPSPPDKPVKYHHWTNAQLPETAQDWLKTSTEITGSWWPSWDNWNKKFSGELVAARKPVNEIEPAPGSYVLS